MLFLFKAKAAFLGYMQAGVTTNSGDSDLVEVKRCFTFYSTAEIFLLLKAKKKVEDVEGNDDLFSFVLVDVRPFFSGSNLPLPETNSKRSENRRFPKRKLIFQPSIFRGGLLVPGRVVTAFYSL